MKQDLLDLTMEEMKTFVAGLGEKPYRGKQLFQWVHRGAASFEEMTDLPKRFREELSGKSLVGRLQPLQVQEDRKDGTRKFLFAVSETGEADSAKAGASVLESGGSDSAKSGSSVLESGGSDSAKAGSAVAEPDGFESGDPATRPAIESVFMKYSYGNTLCVSTQVGCRMGCRFCASARGGFLRNLTAGEMMAQVLGAERQTGEKINHIVLMGMGEPFDNYENVSRFLRIMHDPAGRNMSWRNMTVSTSGIIPVMESFGEDFPQVNLAISLHRIDDAGRSELMPVNRRYPVKELLDAARKYTEKTGRRISFEYALIRGENDRPSDVRLLCEALRGMLCHVNLIPLNEVRESGLAGTDRQRAREIAQQLEASGIPATVRRELGSEIDGACGQLRLRHAVE